MRRYLRERGEPVPFVVQANRQDAEGALPPEDLAQALRLGPDSAPLPAVATSGEGVRETFNAAVRAALAFTKQRVAASGIGAISGQAEGADHLFEALLELEDRVDDMAAEEDPTEEEMVGAFE
jgi:hypothetical protein